MILYYFFDSFSLKLNTTWLFFQGIFQPDNIMIHVGQNIIDVVGSSLIWGLLAVFTAQTDLATSPTVAHGKDAYSSTMDMSKLQGMYKDMASPPATGWDDTYLSSFDVSKSMC